MKGLLWKTVVEKTPRTEFCAAEVTIAVKCKQGDTRPLGEMPPLSDRAPINIQMGEGRAGIAHAKTTSDWIRNLASPVSESTAWYQSSGWNLGDPEESAHRKAVKQAARWNIQAFAEALLEVRVIRSIKEVG